MSIIVEDESPVEMLHLKRDDDAEAAASDGLFLALLAMGVAIVFVFCSWLAWRSFVQPCKEDPRNLHAAFQIPSKRD